MREALVIAVAQPPCVAYDVGANALAHADVVRAAGARVVVFPEMSITGYELDAPVVAPGDQRLAPIVDACRDSGAVALVGGPVGGIGDGAHIGVLVVDGSGVRVAYRKMWLGADEAARFTPGELPAVVEVDGWRLGLAVCKDTGVVRHASDTAAVGMDVYVAGILHHASEAGVHESRALRVAADHGVWVAVASFAGSTGGGYDSALGGSGIWDPNGVVVAAAGARVGAVARATLTPPG